LIATRASFATLLPLSAVSLGETTSAFSPSVGDGRSPPGFVAFRIPLGSLPNYLRRLRFLVARALLLPCFCAVAVRGSGRGGLGSRRLLSVDPAGNRLHSTKRAVCTALGDLGRTAVGSASAATTPLWLGDDGCR
jgi:hypothetical protein